MALSKDQLKLHIRPLEPHIQMLSTPSKKNKKKKNNKKMTLKVVEIHFF